MKQLKVAIIGDGDSPHVNSRIDKFKQRGELTVKLFDPSDEKYQFNKSSSFILTLILKIPKLETSLWLFRRWSHIRKYSPDVLMIMYADTYSLLLSLFFKSGLVISVWGGDILKEQGALQTPFQRFVTKKAFLKADQIFAVSGQLKEEILKLMDSTSIKEPIVLHYGIDLNDYKLKGDNGAITQTNEYDSESRPITIYSPRWCLPLYNISCVIDAFIELTKRTDQVRLYYRDTDFNESKESKEYSAILKSRLLENDVADKTFSIGLLNDEERILLYKKSDIILSLSLSDGTPLSVLEGMAFSKIVVCNRLKSLEAVIVNGDNGFLVDGEDPIDVANTLQSIVDNYSEIYRKIGASARKYVENHANINHEIDEYIQSFKQIL